MNKLNIYCTDVTLYTLPTHYKRPARVTASKQHMPSTLCKRVYPTTLAEYVKIKATFHTAAFSLKFLHSVPLVQVAGMKSNFPYC